MRSVKRWTLITPQAPHTYSYASFSRTNMPLNSIMLAYYGCASTLPPSHCNLTSRSFTVFMCLRHSLSYSNGVDTFGGRPLEYIRLRISVESCYSWFGCPHLTNDLLDLRKTRLKVSINVFAMVLKQRKSEKCS